MGNLGGIAKALSRYSYDCGYSFKLEERGEGSLLNEWTKKHLCNFPKCGRWFESESNLKTHQLRDHCGEALTLDY
jgi:hypothetical protein